MLCKYLISKKISKYYKAAISGDGGDELLGGYKRLYKSINRIKINNRLVSFLFNLYPFWLGSGYILNRNNNLIVNNTKKINKFKHLIGSAESHY